ncbi:MAG: helix-turn-helix domain-containing protein [Treponema sp.]|jgi:transcriptional regulator with XRE-family HTH domain|nr:helix-turn-helix domain-containing protein [Treponema sp.]
MDLKVILGTNLKHYRKEKHESQEQLSEKVDISVKHLSKIERGMTFLSADLLERLSLALGVSVAALFCTNDEKIYDENVLITFDRITEKHLIKAMEGIKADVRQNNNAFSPPADGGLRKPS